MRNFKKYKHASGSTSEAVGVDVPDTIDIMREAVDSLESGKSNFSRRVEVLEAALNRRKGAVIIAVLLDKIEEMSRQPIDTEGMSEELAQAVRGHFEEQDTCMCENCIERRAFEAKNTADVITVTSGEGGHC